MEPESMVHALEQIHDLLVPDGSLIDIHPNGELAEFFYRLDKEDRFIGHMQETDDYIEYHQANDAVEMVVSRGLFRVEIAAEFEFRTYADSLGELKAFLDENWSDAVVTAEVIAKAKKLQKEHGKRPVFLREQTKINLLELSKR